MKAIASSLSSLHIRCKSDRVRSRHVVNVRGINRSTHKTKTYQSWYAQCIAIGPVTPASTVFGKWKLTKTNCAKICVENHVKPRVSSRCVCVHLPSYQAIFVFRGFCSRWGPGSRRARGVICMVVAELRCYSQDHPWPVVFHRIFIEYLFFFLL